MARRSGALVSDYSTRTFGCYDVRGVAFDGTKVHVVEGTEWRAYRSDPGGLPVVRWVASFQGGAQGCTFGPGNNLFVSDWLTDEIREYDSYTGALVGSFSARDFGMFEPLGLAFDGTNLLGADQGQRSVFPMAPGGLDKSTIDLVPLGFSAPRGVCFGPSGNLFFVDDVALSAN